MAERIRDEHSHQIRKLNKDIQGKNKSLANQNQSMAKVCCLLPSATSREMSTQRLGQRCRKMETFDRTSVARENSNVVVHVLVQLRTELTEANRHVQEANQREVLLKRQGSSIHRR